MKKNHFSGDSRATPAKEVAEPIIVYIIGAGHSGSTLLDVLLSLHPKVTGCGEVHRLSIDTENRICGCGRSLMKCAFWSKYIEQESFICEGELVPFSLAKGQYGVSSKLNGALLEILTLINARFLIRVHSHLSSWVGKYLQIIKNSIELYSNIAAEENSDIVIDSTKTPLRGKMLYLMKKDRVKFIHLVRDGRAVTTSMIGREKCSMKFAAKQWRTTVVKVIATLALVKKRDIKRIRYEDLCEDPYTVLSETWNWLGLDDVNSSVLNSLEIMEKHQIPGNPVLFRGIEEIRLDEKWRWKLGSGKRACFNRIAGRINKSFGYE